MLTLGILMTAALLALVCVSFICLLHAAKGMWEPNEDFEIRLLTCTTLLGISIVSLLGTILTYEKQSQPTTQVRTIKVWLVSHEIRSMLTAYSSTGEKAND